MKEFIYTKNTSKPHEIRHDLWLRTTTEKKALETSEITERLLFEEALGSYLNLLSSTNVPDESINATYLSEVVKFFSSPIVERINRKNQLNELTRDFKTRKKGINYSILGTTPAEQILGEGIIDLV